MKHLTLLLLCVLTLLTGCVQSAGKPLQTISDVPMPEISSVSPAASSAAVETASSDLPETTEPILQAENENEDEGPIQNAYIASLLDDTLSRLVTDSMTGYEKILAVYRHLIIETAFFDDPVGTDIWRYRGNPNDIPTVFEVRSLSPLLFGIGSCEDYASAFVTLCSRMGYEARYVPGLTYSVEGELVPHAWAMVKLDGVWYHADPQLEDNIIRSDGLLRYRFFLKSDEIMGRDHRWGGMLEKPDEYALSLPECPLTYASTSPERIISAKKPDRRKIERLLEEERAAYRRVNPPLTELPDFVLPQ